MGMFDRLKKIQATEGAKSDITLESLLAALRSAAAVPGTTNEYLTYGSQVQETYRKYSGKADWGSAQVRMIVDTRVAFVAGEGITIASNDDRFRTWVQEFLRRTRLGGSLFFSAAKGTEMAGRALLHLRAIPGDYPSLSYTPYKESGSYKVDGGKVTFTDERGNPVALPPDRTVYIQTGGDDASPDEPTTRVGLVLTDCENYDRALKDIRRTNHTVSRITPTFKTQSDDETDALSKNIKASGWKIGQAFVGSAEFDYKNAGTGAMDNLKTELACAAKNIAAITAVPVHWQGWTDLMSNRATADDLYQSISNGTIRERTILAESMYDLIIKAQTIYIDAGGTDISAVNRDFTVTINTPDFGRFESLVRALSVAYNDEAISLDDYRSFIPSIDPLETKRQIEKDRKEAAKRNPFGPLDKLEGDDADTDDAAEGEGKKQANLQNGAEK